MVRYKKYDTNLENLSKQLEIFGVAVIPNILSLNQVHQSLDEMWEMLYHLTQNFELPINKENQYSWKSYYDLCPIEDMLLQYWKVGQSKYVWNIRQNIKLIEVFSHLWQVRNEDLLVSFDSISIHFPPEITKIGKFQEEKKNWYHFDQSSEKEGLHCIQGFINLIDINDGDTTLSLYEGSHKYHSSFFKYYQKKIDKDWYQLNDQEINFFKELEEFAVLASAGSLVLWDSRLLHQGILCSRNRIIPNIRSVVYVCMMPRSKCSNRQLEKKKQSFLDQRMTTHWPHQISRVGIYPTKKEKLNTCWYKVISVSQPKLNNLGLRLAGF